MAPEPINASETSDIEAALKKLPLYFIENVGQSDPRVAFYIQGRETSAYFTSSGITYVLAGPAEGDASSAVRQRWVVKLDFANANPEVQPVGYDKTEAVISYFKGQPSDWKTGLPTYARVVYPDLWPGIDLVYTGAGGRLKYNFVVQPGADPNQIELVYRGATSVEVTEEGRLAVQTGAGTLEDDVPYAYQEEGESRKEVSVEFALAGRDENGAYRYGFRLGAYDSTRPLIVDPALIYCGYIGGSGTETAYAIAVDGSGNAYVTGVTSSTEADFPVTVGPDTTYSAGQEGFVAKVSADGTALLYCGYIGGGGLDTILDVDVDSSGNAYVTGYTDTKQTGSASSKFPVTVGPDLTYNGGTYDAFVAKVNSAGTALDYCGYIGGSGADYGRGIAVDSGDAYVVGSTESTEATFPVTVGPDLTSNGGTEVWVAKVKAVPTEPGGLDYCGYIGGSGYDMSHGIAVDGSGNAYVIGETASTEADFPVTVGPDLTQNGGNDVYVAKVNTAGTALDYCGYIGGSGSETGEGIAVDDSGNAYVTGGTSSTPAQNFPVTVGPDLTHNGGIWDAFVAKVKAVPTEPSGLDYCGYIGGSDSDSATGIAVDASGNAYVIGDTFSTPAQNFPVTGGPYLTHSGDRDAFVAKVKAVPTEPSGLDYCGYIGGSFTDNGDGIAVDGSGSAYVVGSTYSTEADFPVTVGPDLTFSGGVGTDAFVAKLPPAWIAASPVFYSVGISGATNLRSSSSLTVDITSGRAIFSEPQADNIGVGDEITYNTSTKVYITGRTSSTVYSVSTATGGVPTDFNGAVDAINRAFPSLSAAQTGSWDVDHLGDQDLVAANIKLYWPCYNDGAMNDTVTLSGWTTGPDNYIRIYTPRLSNEVGVSQRHTGTAGTGFRLTPANVTQQGYDIVTVQTQYARIEGIEIDGSGLSAAWYVRGITISQTVTNAGEFRLDSCIIHDLHSTTGNVNFHGSWGFYSYQDVDNMGPPLLITNNIVYDITSAPSIEEDNHYIGGFHIGSRATSYLYNNTVYSIHQNGNAPGGPAWGILSSASFSPDSVIAVAKNNFIGDVDSLIDQSQCYYAWGGGVLTQSYNVSSDDTAAGTGSQINKTDYATYFEDITGGSEDLHITADSYALWGAYAEDLSGTFLHDIDMGRRNIPWDIGADESFDTSACPTNNPSWYNASWQYRRAVVINSSLVTGDLNNFPVLVDIPSHTGLAENAQTNGEDILFTADDGTTKLSHEIEEFVKASGKLVAWVKLPSVASASNTVFWMYYGNGAAAPQEDAQNVWDTNYKGVWHLHDDFLDSTATLNHGTPTGTTNASPGEIADGQTFNGTSDYIQTPSTELKTADDITLSVWFKTDSTTPRHMLWQGGIGASDNGWGNGLCCGTEPEMNLSFGTIQAATPVPDYLSFFLSDTDEEDSGGDSLHIAIPFTETTEWHQAVAVVANLSTAPAATLYLDGVVVGTDTGTLTRTDRTPWLTPLRIGRPGVDDRYHDGNLDEVRISVIDRPLAWVETEYNNQSNPSGFCIICGTTTAVDLVSFEARARDGAVELMWETSSELDNLGFHLHRATSLEGPYERITSHVIPGLGSSPQGARYSYVDSGLTNGVTYYYKLEDIETTGRTKLHGPVSARPSEDEPGVGVDDPEGASEDGTEARIVYGDPTANRFKVLSRDARQIVMELVTEGFYATAQEDGSVALEVPGFQELRGPDSPNIPVHRSWIEAVPGLKVDLLSVDVEGVQTFSSLRPTSAESVDVVANERGVVRARRQRGSQWKAEPGLYPPDSARIVDVAFQGDAKKALVEMAPLQWDAGSGELRLASRLVVLIAFRGREPSERTLPGGRGRRFRRRTVHPSGSLIARLVTVEEGLYEVTYESLFGRRGQTIPTSGLRLSRQGEPVAFYVRPNSDAFGPGSTLYFWSGGATENPYDKEAVYELELGSDGALMAEISAAPDGYRLPPYWKPLDREVNRIYQAALLEAPDLWLWDTLSAPMTKSYAFEVSALSATAESSRITVWLQGVSDLPVSPDHHVRVFLNGAFLVEEWWNGKAPRQLTAEVGPGLLREGDNTLEIENVGDTGAAYSMVMLDRFQVVYPRHPVAEGETLEGTWAQSGTATVEGLGAGTFVLDVTNRARPGWLLGATADEDGLSFQVEGGRTYEVFAKTSLRMPSVVRPAPTSLKSARNHADYLAVGPREFLPAVGPLLELRRGQGLVAKAVAVEDVYSEFGFGERTPHAVRDFLAYAYHNWRGPTPRYVLLLGDATYDFKDYMGTGVENRVPPLIVKTSYLWTVSDPSLAAVNGDDILPDLAIGRLPAQTVEELEVMVGKIIAYETEGTAGPAPVILIADNPDEAGHFVANAEELAQTLLSQADVRKIYLSQLGTADTREAIVQAFDEGSSLMSYIGHGGIHLWANENIFNAGQVSSLGEQPRQPLLLTMNCLNGFFHYPYLDSLAEELLAADSKGVIAAFSPSGMSLNTPAHAYHRALLEELLQGDSERLGDAILKAQSRYLETGVFPELLSIYHLFGDPALRLGSGVKSSEH